MTMQQQLAATVGLVIALAAAVQAGAAEPAATNLAPITVSATGIAPAWVVGQNDTIARALAAEPGVVLQSQGGYAAQNDLSIRGSSFSGAGLSLAGLSLRNPQTEHVNAELPLPSSLLTPPRVLTGLDQARATDGHLVGSVAQEFAPVKPTRRLSGGIGETDRQWESALVQEPVATGPRGAQWGASAFGAHESADAVDYPDNDVDLWNAGGRVQVISPEGQADLAAAHQEKDFGARGYYGLSPTLPADEQVEDTLLVFSGRRGSLEESFARLSAQWRELDDDYTILPAVYVNHTASRELSAFADGRQALPADVSVAWRTGVEGEDMESVKLGNHDRQRGVFQLLPGWEHGALGLTAGARGEVFSGDEPAVLPQAGVDLKVCEAATLYASYTETVRQPSFTELNYESPGSLGNSGLQRQDARALEGGVRTRLGDHAEGHAALFQQWSEQTVDWVRKTPASTRYEAVNIGDVDTLGAEVGASAELGRRVGVQAQYTWLDKGDDAEVYASRYALDYAQHLLQLSAVWRAAQTVSFTATQLLRWQEDNPMRTTGSEAAIGSGAANLALPTFPNGVLTLALDNVWDDDYQVFAGQKVAGRRASAGVTLDW